MQGFRAAGHLQQLTTARVFEAWAHLRRGDIRAAVPAAAEAARMAAETRQPRFVAVAKAALAVAAAERGDPAASKLANEAEAVLLPMGANPLLAVVELARGRIALAGERFTEACDHFGRIFDPADIAHLPFVRGCGPLREAADAFTALGSTRSADRALRELPASGEAVHRRRPEAWDQLTAQELQIAQLAADGLTNREIGERLYISHRTVGTHLYQLFPKLGVTSRSELRAALEPAARDQAPD